MFLHKAIKPARLFVNRILALLRDMGDAHQAAIDEGTHQDLRWFIACAHVVNGTVSIFKCLRPRLDVFVDASLQGLGGPSVPWFTGLHCPTVLGGALPTGRPSTFTWLSRFSLLIFEVRLSLFGLTLKFLFMFFTPAGGSDPFLHSIARNICLLQTAFDCDLEFRHIPGWHNTVAYLLSRWDAHPDPYLRGPYRRGQALTVWSDSQVSVHVLHSGRGSDPVFHSIARNIWLLQTALDCDLEFRHIPGRHNTVADLLSRWDAHPDPGPLLSSLLPSPPVWCEVPSMCLDLDSSI
jgi:hypothetical protein